VRHAVYLEVGGLDEVNLPMAFNDLDFGLRLIERGLRNVWTPFAELLHLESASRGSYVVPEQIARADGEFRTMRECRGPQLDSEPYYNSNLSRIDLTHPLPRAARRTPPWRFAETEFAAP
jgi:O-antigen biosynthesis protein